MQTPHQHTPDTTDDVLCGLAVYSSDLVPLGRVTDVVPPRPPGRDTIAGRAVMSEPNPTVRYVLDGADLVVSESMIFHAEANRGSRHPEPAGAAGRRAVR